MKKLFIAAALATLASGACQQTAAYRDVVDNTDWNYGGMVVDSTKDMFLDLFDIVDFNLGAGDGILLDVQPTKIAHVGMGWADAVRVGIRPRAFGMWSQRQAEYGLSVFYWRDINRQAAVGTSTLFDQSMSYKGFDLDHQNETGHWLDIGVNVHALLIGGELFVSPKETLDFVFSVGRWVFTVIPVRSLLHVCGADVIPLDPSSDNTEAPWREAGGSAAGAVHQGDTPFYERSRNPSTALPPMPADNP